MTKKWEWSPEVEQEKQKQKWENAIIESGVVVRACSPNTQGTEAGGSRLFQG